MKKKISLILALVLMLSTIFSVNVFAATPTVYSQRDSRWGNYAYGRGDKGPATIGSAGCALLSLTNAVYYLNGNFIEPKTLADFAIEKECRINCSGTDDCFVKHAAEKFGSQYGFKYAGTVGTESKLKSALQKGQVAIWHSPNHFMAIVNYNSNTNKYLVLNSETGTKTKKASAEITYSAIKSTYKIRTNDPYKGFMLIERTSTSNDNSSTIKWPSTSKIKTYVKSSGNNTTVYETATSTKKYGTIYASDLITINGYSGSRLKVTYPISKGTKTGFIDISAVTSGKVNVATSKWTATSKITTYRRSGGGSTLGSISKGDVCYTISTNGNWQQVIYPISGGYKMGWIKK